MKRFAMAFNKFKNDFINNLLDMQILFFVNKNSEMLML